jgi:hypothetical protein
MTEPQTKTQYAPCEHKFGRLLMTTTGDVNNCSKCNWTFFQVHTGAKAGEVIGLGKLIPKATLPVAETTEPEHQFG